MKWTQKLAHNVQRVKDPVSVKESISSAQLNSSRFFIKKFVAATYALIIGGSSSECPPFGIIHKLLPFQF